MDKQELIDFEKEIADLFERGQIKAPVHLVGNNEDQLIEIFKNIKPEHWVFSNHRSHYHALLKGVPRDWLKNEILKGHSITINSAEHRFFSSAIVGGILPIAVGVALSGATVWCFLGDMAAQTGIFHECLEYARHPGCNITFVVEDNGLSVETPTERVWSYKYDRVWPHQGVGHFVIF